MDENKLYVQELDDVSEAICHNFPQEEKCRALNTYVRIYIEKDVIPVATYLILDLAPVFKDNLQFADLENCIFAPESKQYDQISRHIERWRKIHSNNLQAKSENIRDCE